MTTALTAYGKVSGQVVDGVTRFLGIPYAASPTGSRRVRAPEPPEPWGGARECRAFGPTQPKPGFRPPLDSLLSEPNIPGDDWLTLNVWTPALDGAAPVMLWISRRRVH
jgi:para-nitrobenzyl esterase